jgi:hypothetical protein
VVVANHHNQLARKATMSHTATTITIIPRATSALSEQYSKQPGSAGVRAVLTSEAKMARQMTVHKIVNRQRMRNPTSTIRSPVAVECRCAQWDWQGERMKCGASAVAFSLVVGRSASRTRPTHCR